MNHKSEECEVIGLEGTFLLQAQYRLPESQHVVKLIICQTKILLVLLPISIINL